MADKKRPFIMAIKYLDGFTLEQIGEEFNVTRERVRQLLSGIGVTKTDGGARVRSVHRTFKVKKDAKERAEEKSLAIYGCDIATANKLNGERGRSRPGTKARCYIEQRRTAMGRGIPWEITFPQWVRIWNKSGKWDSRGKGNNGYCMCRKGDTGPYSALNVEIKNSIENSREGIYSRKDWKKSGFQYKKLTPRQKEVWQLYENKLSCPEIARKLGMAVGTIYSNVSSARRKIELYGADAINSD